MAELNLIPIILGVSHVVSEVFIATLKGATAIHVMKKNLKKRLPKVIQIGSSVTTFGHFHSSTFFLHMN